MINSGRRFKKISTVIISILIISIFSNSFIPRVKSLDNPYIYFGYIYYSNGTAIPAGVTVTLTDDSNQNSMTTNTIDLGGGTTNYYQADVSQITGSADGDLIIVNCTVNNQVGDHGKTINLTLGSRRVDVNITSLPTIEMPSPANQSTNIAATPKLSVIVNDSDGHTVNLTWYSNSSGSWLPFGWNLSASCNQTFSQINSNFSATDTTFFWNISVNDGFETNNSPVYHFRTAAAAGDASITVTPANWDQGSLALGSSNETSGTYFNLSNVGDVAINVTVKASNATNSTSGFSWNLTSTAAQNNFTLEYKKDGDAGWTNINLTYDTFISDLAVGWGKDFDLKLTLATNSTQVAPMSFNVTFKSVIA